MAVTKTWKVYGVDGHRQRESFNKSRKYDFSVTCDTEEECIAELEGQLSDGIFENSRVGKVVEI